MLTLVAVLLRISGVAFVANAYGSVQCYVAATVKTARIESTRVDAFLIEAGIVVRTFGIMSTFWNRFCKYTIKG